MLPFQPVRRRQAALWPLVILAAAAAHPAQAQSGGFVAGSRTLFSLDLKGEDLGEFPTGIRLLRGNMTIVDKDGTRALRSSDPGEFLITFREPLPPDFTLEVDLIPKTCCNPTDLMFEGTATQSRSATSMQVEWHPATIIAVGGGEYFQMPMPGDLSEVLPAQPVEIAASMDGETFSLYTNGRLLTTLNNRKFPRGRVLRISLGGQDDDKYAVYLTRLRVATNSPPPPPKP